tara:strand:- start:10 stop:462 length:453 start_codon:yes stop_codon:yes gene_type:complete
MALVVSAGTETLHAASFADTDADQDLIVGVVHHIYTVLSTIVFTVSIGTAGDVYELLILGHDHFGDATSQANPMIIAKVVAVAGQTFVFNDKFSFNGFSSAAYTEPMSTNTEQATIAQQGGSVAQHYQIHPLDTAVITDVTVTFIDQNNA